MTNCPKCNYCLQGLPAVHTCPECGLAYDPDCVVLMLHPRGGVESQLVLGAGLLGLFALVGARTGFNREDLNVIGFILLCMTAAVIKWARGHDHPYVVIINHNGVQFDHPTRGTDVLPWTNLQSARCSWVTGKFKLISPDRRTLFRCPSQALGGVKPARQLARLTNARRLVYTGNPQIA